MNERILIEIYYSKIGKDQRNQKNFELAIGG